MSKQLSEIEWSLVDDNPLNNQIFNTGEDEYNAVFHSVKIHGVLQACHVFPTADGRFRLLSGHNRKRAAIENGLKAGRFEVMQKPDSEAWEAFLVYSFNVSRSLKSAWKIKLYKLMYHILCQIRENGLDANVADGLDDVGRAFVSNCTKSGIQVKGKRTHELITELLGFTRYEQDRLKLLTNEDEREAILAKIPKDRLKKNGLDEYRKKWAAIEQSVIDEEIGLGEAVAMIESFVADIEKLNKKKSKPKGDKPQKVEVEDVETGQGVLIMWDEFKSMFGFTMNPDDAINVLTDSDGEVHIAVPFSNGAVLLSSDFIRDISLNYI